MLVDTHLEVDVTDADPLTGKPVAMQDLVRVAVEGELMKGGVHNGDLAEDRCARAYGSVVKEMIKWERVPGEAGDSLEVLWTPNLLETHNVIVRVCQMLTNGSHPDHSVPGHSHPYAPAVKGKH